MADKYDIGLPGSPYFKDLNEGKTKEVTETYCTCDGEEFCVTTEELLPFIPKQSIIAPVFIAMIWGTQRFRVACINKKMFTGKSRYGYHDEDHLYIQYPFRVGDIFKVKGDKCAEYYVHRRVKRGMQECGWLVQVKRVDKEPMTEADRKKFKKGKRLHTCGYFAEAKVDI